MRQTPSLYGQELREALHLEQVWEKSEQLPAYLPFFVGSDLIHQIHNNSNQLIVGRRGTGKTHLLGAFTEHIRASSKHELAIRVSIMELGQTPPLPHTESPDFTAKRMARDKFDQFLRLFYSRLLSSVSMLFNNKHIVAKPGKTLKQFRHDADDVLLQMMEAIELGKEYHVSKVRRRTNRQKKASRRGASGELGAGINGCAPSLHASIGFAKGAQNDGEESVETTIDSIIDIDLFAFRQLLSSLIDTLNLKTLFILVDEWMEIDKNTPSSIQAYFGQLLKITFFNHPHIAVKIASVWHETTLYSKGDMTRAQGLQLGHDIQMGPDLDTAFLSDQDAVFGFSKTLLFKRLSHACPSLGILSQGDVVDDIFISEIFDNTSNFKAYLAASHGIPRDMMKLFFKCSLRIRGNFEKECIDYRLVSSVAKDVYRTVKRKSIDPGSTAQLMLNMIDKYLEATGRRVFLIENSQVKSCAHLRELVDDEIVHRIPSSMTPRHIRDTHKAFHIDYGNMVDWIDAKRLDISEILSHSLLPDFSGIKETDIDAYVLDALSVSHEHICCGNCGYGFMRTNPVFAKVGICPRCAEKPL